MPVCGIRWIYTLGYRCCNASGIMHRPKRSSNHPLLQAGRAALGRHCSLTAVLHLLWASGWDEVSPRASTALSVVFHACKVSSKWGCNIITGAQPIPHVSQFWRKLCCMFAFNWGFVVCFFSPVTTCLKMSFGWFYFSNFNITLQERTGFLWEVLFAGSKAMFAGCREFEF